MIVYGKQILSALITRHADIIKEIYLAKELDKGEFHAISKLNKPIKRIDAKKAQALAKGGNHQGRFAKIKDIEPCEFATLKTQANALLVLCGLSDVGNIGAIFRSGYALGADGIIITNANLSQNAMEGIARRSAGAFFELPFCAVKNPYDLANELKMAGFALIAADAKGEVLKADSAQNAQKFALFLGAESTGLPQKLLSKMDRICAIKMRRDFESLNVGIAAALLLDRLLERGEHGNT